MAHSQSGKSILHQVVRMNQSYGRIGIHRTVWSFARDCVTRVILDAYPTICLVHSHHVVHNILHWLAVYLNVLTCVVYNECEIIIVFSHCGDSECRGRKKIPRPCACGARLSEYLVLSSYKLPWSAKISKVCDRSNGRNEPTAQRFQPVWEPLPGKNGNLICFVFRRT